MSEGIPAPAVPLLSLGDELARLGTREEVPGGTTLAERGQPVRDVILALSGELGGATSGSRWPPGHVLGLPGLFSAAVWEEDIVTTRDSTVARLPTTRLLEASATAPALSHTLLRQQLAAGPSPRPNTLLVLVLDPGVDAGWLLEQLSLGDGRMVLAPGVRPPDGLPEGRLWIAVRSDDHQHLSWCVRNADHLVVVADATAPPAPRPWELPLLDPATRPPTLALHLVLLQRAGVRHARATAPWLDARPGWTHHHVRHGCAEDARRAARRMLGEAVGWVFSAASSRGFAHLGVADALERGGVAMDRTVGISSGSFMALLAAAGLASSKRMEAAVRMVQAARPRWYEAVPPFVSLFDGHRLRDCLQEIFEEIQLEDLLVPCTVLAADLYSGQVVELERGPAWLAMRAANSLPVYWPPVRWGDRLLVDAGCFDLLPLERLGPECAQGWKVVSDLRPTGDVLRSTYPDYVDVLSGWRLLWRRLRGRERGPSLQDLLIRCVTLSTRRRPALLAPLLAGERVVHLIPEVRLQPLLAVREEGPIRRLYEQGLRHTEEALRGRTDLPRRAGS